MCFVCVRVGRSDHQPASDDYGHEGEALAEERVLPGYARPRGAGAGGAAGHGGRSGGGDASPPERGKANGN